MQIGEKIKNYRKTAGLTQEQVADYLDVSTPAVNKWEKGNTYPDISLLPAILRTSVLIPYSGIWIPNRNRTSIRKVNINFSFKPEAFHIDIKSAVVGILMPLFTPCVIILIQPFRLLLQFFLLYCYR